MPAVETEKLLVNAKEAAALLSISVAKLWALNAAGQLPAPVRLACRRTLWSLAELKSWARHGCPSRIRWALIWEAECNEN